MNSIMINDVKKGTRIRMKSGEIGEMMDSVRGVIRMIKVPSPIFPNATAIGSEYVFKIEAAEINGQWVKVMLSEKQQEQCKRIKGFLQPYRS